MPGQSDWTVWEKRGAAQNQVMSDLANLLGAPTTMAFYQKKTLQNMVLRLLHFATYQFHFFFDGLGRQTIRRLESGKTYPPEYAFGLTLDQAAFDLEVIQRAAFQRMAGNDQARSTLQRADQLAWLALQSAVDAGLFQTKPTVVTYFQKSMSIRLIPYAPVALIGIPLSCMYDPLDYLAISHEIGHYIYWHGKLPGGQTIEQAVSASANGYPNYIQNWREEIFADIYGCIIGGPVVALDFQDLQLENWDDKKSEEGFRKDDEAHPIPLIRPYIYSETLGQIADQLVPGLGSKDKLKGHWEAELEKRDASLSAGMAIKAKTEESVVIDDKGPIDLSTVVTKLLSSPPLSLIPQPKTTWSWNLSPGTWQVAGLYDQFMMHIDDLIAPLGPYSPPDPATWPPFSWEEWFKKEFNLAGVQIPVGDPTVEAPVGWIHVLKARGWTTKWPHTRD